MTGRDNASLTNLPRVALATLGGTVTMAKVDQMPGALPVLDADQLVAAVPELDGLASLTTATLASLPSASLHRPVLERTLRWAQECIEAGARGVVLLQGTDTIEETAYWFGLHWRHAEPLIVTGAMRLSDAAGADGPANLLGAVAVALDSASRQRGVLVVFNDEIHACRWVQKTDSISIAAFASPGIGPLGRIVEGKPWFHHPPSRLPEPLPPPQRDVRVARLDVGLDDDGALLGAVAQGGFEALLVAGYGAGHVPQAWAPRLEQLAGRLPVVVAGRPGRGPTLSTTYRFAGGELDLRERGVLMAGWLAPAKARILLRALLAANVAPGRLAASWETYAAA
ncbi:MAG: asparaginase [Pigmentiphaga sp.]